MFPFSPSSSTLSSIPPTLDTISELDVLSVLSWTGGEQQQLDGDELLPHPCTTAVSSNQYPIRPTAPSPSPALPPTPSSSSSSSPGCDCCDQSLESEAQPQPQPPRSGFSILAACKGLRLRLPSLLDEDGYLCFPSLPEESLAAVLPAGLQRHLPLSSPSLVPSFLVVFAVLLSASQSLGLALLLALPLALALCYLEARASSRLLPPQAPQYTELGTPEEMCDPAA